MLTEKDYCDYETCVALRELGFPQDYIFARYAKVDKLVECTYHKKGDLIISEDRFAFTLESESIVAPLLYEAQKWLREEKKIDVFVRAGYLGKNRVRHYFVEVFTSKDVITLDNDRDDFESYEEALSEGIKEAVKILKEE